MVVLVDPNLLVVEDNFLVVVLVEDNCLEVPNFLVVVDLDYFL